MTMLPPNLFKLIAVIILTAFTGVVSSALVFEDSSVQSDKDQPAVVSAVIPVYPPAFSTETGPMDVDSTVFVEVDIDKTGAVISAKATHGHPVLQSAAQSAAQRWRFAPSDNESVRTVTLAFVFITMPKTASDEEIASVFKSPYIVEIKHRSIAVNPKKHSRKKPPIP